MSSAPRYVDFQNMLLRLLPPGDLLDTQDLDGELARFFEAFAKELERLEAAGENLLVDLDPRVTTLHLADWERLLALPECGGAILDTTEARRAAAHTKYAAEKNLSLAYIEAACISAGHDVTITDPGTVDHQFEVDLVGFAFVEFRTGESTTGDRLGSWGNDELACLLNRLKPHHTTYVLTTPP